GRRTVRENVPQMATAAFADHFRAAHAMAGVKYLLNLAFFQRSVKAGPSAAGIKLGLRLKQWLAAAFAMVYPILKQIPIGTGKSGFGALFPADTIFFRC